MRRKRPHVASLDEVRITREAEAAVIEYADPALWRTHLTLGPKVWARRQKAIGQCRGAGRNALGAEADRGRHRRSRRA